MEEIIEFTANDTYRGIGKLIDDLKAFDSPLCDPRIRAVIITDLEKTQLMSLKLIKPDGK